MCDVACPWQRTGIFTSLYKHLGILVVFLVETCRKKTSKALHISSNHIEWCIKACCKEEMTEFRTFTIFPTLSVLKRISWICRSLEVSRRDLVYRSVVDPGLYPRVGQLAAFFFNSTTITRQCYICKMLS
jgi:hypothetical protein